MEIFTERLEAQKRAEREAAARQRQATVDRRHEKEDGRAQAERDATAAAIRRLKPALEKALREPIGEPNRAGARSFLHGQIAGTFHNMFPGQSPRWDALQALATDLRVLPATSALTGGASVYTLLPAQIAEVDAIECAVWRAQLETARIIAGEVENK